MIQQTTPSAQVAWLCPECRHELSGTCQPETEDWRCTQCGHTVPMIEGILTFAPLIAEKIEGYDSRFFDLTASIEGKHFWFGPRRRFLASLVDRHFPEAASYLELGCGTGDMLSTVLQSRTWSKIQGSDIYPSSLQRVAARLGRKVGLVQLDARDIPARQQFDIITAFDVIEHITEDERVLASMHSAIVPGGGVVIAVPQHPLLWSHTDDIGHHVRRYRPGEMEKKLQRVGFTVVYSNSYTALLLPLLLASRMAYKFRSKLHGADVDLYEYDVPRVANSVLKSILEVEVNMALAGVPFPAGGSRIVVARK
jgi:SAM-dependent methyltransferase